LFGFIIHNTTSTDEKNTHKEIKPLSKAIRFTRENLWLLFEEIISTLTSK
jgi:hypothetical protein